MKKNCFEMIESQTSGSSESLERYYGSQVMKNINTIEHSTINICLMKKSPQKIEKKANFP